MGYLELIRFLQGVMYKSRIDTYYEVIMYYYDKDHWVKHAASNDYTVRLDSRWYYIHFSKDMNYEDNGNTLKIEVI